MARSIEFYFDFSSPYGYFASTRIDALAARFERDVEWHPILLGVSFKTTGNQPLVSQPLKGAYSLHDFRRTARFLGIPYEQPQHFPVATHHAARAFYWLHDHDPERAKLFARAVFHAYFFGGNDISSLEMVIKIFEATGYSGAGLDAVLQDASVKERLKKEVEHSLEKGVFGSPFFIVDGEPFWGNDRLDQLESWLESGGW